MLVDAIPFKEAWIALYGDKSSPLKSFISFIEKRLGAKFIYDGGTIAYGHTDLLDLFELAEKMRGGGVIKSFNPVFGLPDEPPFLQWRADIVGGQPSGGYSIVSDRSALTAALAEALERHLWHSATDYFQYPTLANIGGIQKRGRALLPDTFAGFSAVQRAERERLTFRADSQYLWIRGRSLVRRDAVWVPAQVVSGKHGGENFRKGSEPIILEPITTGLATGPTREFALLNGALEIIERDAFMITWLNQLTPPRIDLEEIRVHSEPIEKLLKKCTRYGLRIDAVHLPTDAPAHAVCAVATDERGHSPVRTVGLKAHRGIAEAVVGAAQEALRARLNTRYRLSKGDDNQNDKAGDSLVHTERLAYWAQGDRHKKLDFLVNGVIERRESDGMADSVESHLRRIVEWCKSRSYEMAAVPITSSKKNVSPWHVEMVIMPELIPVHQNEKYRYDGGARRIEVAEKFGFKAKPRAFHDEPHPFA